jgi:serine/threonine-protein kinase
MSLPPNTRLGVFEILSPLGAGGMGEVYLARDTELKREVAIKVLPDSLARDADRVARFEQEARLLASLNHPNIGAIFGLERSDDLLYLVLELVRGETLAERLEHGPVSLREALTIFQQIAQALEAAHDKGIVHRDLKPQNVKITPQGVVKVLDFGLAKVFVEKAPLGSAAKTRTGPFRMTREGHILGTPGYMSPEQARAQAVDKRTDIWSYGCCLFESLSGRHPFEGKTTSDVLAAVLSQDPDFGALPVAAPRNIRKLLRRCLEKDARQRLHDIADARIEIEEALSAPIVEEPEPRARLSPAWMAAGLAIALVAGFGLGQLTDVDEADDRLVRRFAIDLSPTEPIALGAGPAVAISPDGSRIVYVAHRGDTTELRMRAMERLEPTELPDTEGASGPFFSPTGDVIGFFSGGKLRRIALGELRVQTLVESPSPRGASFRGQDEIVLSPRTVGGLASVMAHSPTATPLTELAPDGDVRSHRWPAVLPNATHALFTSWTGSRFDVEVVFLETGGRKHLVENGSYPKYAPTGHLVFARDDDMMAVPFDLRKLQVSGEPVVIVENIHRDPLTGAAFFDFSREGTLAYVPRADESTIEVSGRLLRVNREGASTVLLPSPRSYQVPRVSPSGRRIIFTLTDEEETDVWTAELDRGTMSRFTFEGNNGAAIWTPDGVRATFSSDREGALNLYWKRIDGSAPVERLTSSANAQFPSSWSPDGERLAYTELDPNSGLDIWVFSTKNGYAKPFLETGFNESAAVFSPDGRFLAYVSDETGEDEVYVRAYPGPGGKWTISNGGGREPVWSSDGTEIYYRGQEWVTAVPIETEPAFQPGKSRHLFEAPFDEAGAPYANYDVAPDGRGFVMVRSDEELSATRLIIVFNWFEELQNRIPSDSGY